MSLCRGGLVTRHYAAYAERVRLRWRRVVCILAKDDATEKPLAKPVLLQIAWSAEIEAQLQKAGMPASCYAKEPPRLLQISEKSGLRAGVLVIPRDLSDACPAVRVVVTNSNKVYLAD